jgi:uncharacterized protein YodC (DUF2158 family)
MPRMSITDYEHEDVGKVVELTCGGPRMTVVGMDTLWVECAWHLGSGIATANFPRKALRFVDDPETCQHCGRANCGSLEPDVSCCRCDSGRIGYCPQCEER